MRNAVHWFFFHLGQDIANDLRGFIRTSLKSGSVNGDIGELWPRKSVIKIVFQKIVFGKIGDVCRLNMGNIRGSKYSNIHCMIDLLPIG